MPRRRIHRCALAACAALALVAPLAVTATPSRADAAVAPYNATVTVTGSGYGHGIGASQWGAYGAAGSGLSYSSILAFYYPGTRLGTLPPGNTIRVWISADTDGSVDLVPAPGLRVRDTSGHVYTMRTGPSFKQWRIRRSGSSRVLEYLTGSGRWYPASTGLRATDAWWAETDARYVSVRLPNGTVRELWGQAGLGFAGTGGRTVNRLPLESYLRSVVPSEMPAAWPAEALKAQSVAARTFAARARANASRTAPYDVCDTVACQVYRGRSQVTSTGRTMFEYPATDSAIKKTANRVLLTRTGRLALTMFSASNGGATASGGSSYLPAKPDPYDGRLKNQAWSASLSASQIQAAYPAIGSLRSVAVTGRDGVGAWGGRVTSISLRGSSGSVTVSGTAFRSKFRLRSHLFKVTGGLRPGSGNHRRWQQLGGVTGSLGQPLTNEAPTANGALATSGAWVRFGGGDLYWSSKTGSRRLTSAVAARYRAMGGASSRLGFPVSDSTWSAKTQRARFQGGTITCTTASSCTVALG